MTVLASAGLIKWLCSQETAIPHTQILPKYPFNVYVDDSHFETEMSLEEKVLDESHNLPDVCITWKFPFLLLITFFISVLF